MSTETGRKTDSAQKLLRAMTDVDDQYIEEAARFGEKDAEPTDERIRKIEGIKRNETDIRQNAGEAGKDSSDTAKIRKARRWTGILAAAAICFLVALLGRTVYMLTRPMGSSSPYTGEALSDSGSMNAAEDAMPETVTSETEESEEAAGTASAEIPNPYVEVGSLSEAEELTGFSMNVPDAEEPYSRMVISVLDNSMIEAAYYTADGTEEGYAIRKAEGDDDISGDYNDYAETVSEDAGGVTVTMKGDGSVWSVAIWNSDGYTYAIDAQDHPLTSSQIINIVRETV